MTERGTLVNGLEVRAAAKREGSGIRVTLWAEPSELTQAYDRGFRANLDDYLAAAERGEHRGEEFPKTGAEALMSGVTLRGLDGVAAPNSVTSEAGGSEHPWQIVYRSPSWQPAEVLLAGAGIALHVAVEN